ncbi:MAG: hypothetical protein ACOY93_17960 [Bacillota bacterium]
MGGRWLWWAGAVLALLGMTGGAWLPTAWEQRLPGAEPVAVVDPAAGEGCARLAALRPVELLVRLPGGPARRVGTGYREPDGPLVLAPVRPLVSPLAPGPLGVHWEEGVRTASLLREGRVLSIHFPEGRERSAVAILNGEVVGAEAFLCEGRLFASLQLLAEGLDLTFRWHDARSILVEPRR